MVYLEVYERLDDEGRVVGKHVYGSFYGIPREKAFDEKYLRSLMARAAEAAGATVHAVNSWTIPGDKGGVSVIVLVLESHLALHTWPHYDYATFDIYTCGSHTDPWKAFDLLLRELGPRRYKVHYSDRSQEEGDVEADVHTPVASGAEKSM